MWLVLRFVWKLAVPLECLPLASFPPQSLHVSPHLWSQPIAALRPSCPISQSYLTLVTPWTITCLAPLSMGFSRQEYWSGCHFLLQRIFLTQGSNSHLLHLLHWQADSLPLNHVGSPTMMTDMLKFPVLPEGIKLCGCMHKKYNNFWSSFP